MGRNRVPKNGQCCEVKSTAVDLVDAGVIFCRYSVPSGTSLQWDVFFTDILSLRDIP